MTGLPTPERKSRAGRPRISLPKADHKKLTKREREVVSLVSLGYSDNEIASFLGLKKSTVSTVISRIHTKGPYYYA